MDNTDRALQLWHEGLPRQAINTLRSHGWINPGSHYFFERRENQFDSSQNAYCLINPSACMAHITELQAQISRYRKQIWPNHNDRLGAALYIHLKEGQLAKTKHMYELATQAHNMTFLISALPANPFLNLSSPITPI